MERRGTFDYILLETTGLADPGNIAPLFWVDDGLGSSIYLDGIVTLVDAKNILHMLEEPAPEEVQEPRGDAPLTLAHLQISHADVIILNKSDLVTPAELETVKQRIKSINSLATIHVTDHSKISQIEGTVLDLHAYDKLATVDFQEKGQSKLDPVSWQILGGQETADVSSLSLHFRLHSPISQKTKCRWWTLGCAQCCGNSSYRQTVAQTQISKSTESRVLSVWRIPKPGLSRAYEKYSRLRIRKPEHFHLLFQAPRWCLSERDWVRTVRCGRKAFWLPLHSRGGYSGHPPNAVSISLPSLVMTSHEYMRVDQRKMEITPRYQRAHSTNFVSIEK